MTAFAYGRHALIIEDEMLIALEVESLLHEFGFTSCDIADNPKDALRLALARPPKPAEITMARDFFTKGGTLQEFCLALLNRNEFIYIP